MKVYESTEKETIVRPARRFGLVITSILFAVVLAFCGATIYAVFNRSENYRVQLENMYSRSFYDLSDNMNNLEVKLSKLIVTSNQRDAIKTLNDVSRQTEIASATLAALPTSEDTLQFTQKFINQLGDYCKSLSNKLSSGSKLSSTDYEQLEKLYDINNKLGGELQKISAQIAKGYSFTHAMTHKSNGDKLLHDGFNEIQQGSVEYPKLIYDGPFSDGIVNQTPQGLPKTEVTLEQAIDSLKEQLNAFAIKTVTHIGDTDGKFYTYNFTVTTEAGSQMTAQISRLGGKLILLDNMRTLDNFSLEVKDCITKAEEFIQKMGFSNMKSVWASDYSGYVYINLAPIMDDIIYYPDLIKVIVSRDSGELLGFEAQAYYTNHIARKTLTAQKTKLECRQQVFDKLDIESERLALIPLDNGKEVLCYEFYGNYHDLLYFVYVDTLSGEEVNVLRVLDSEDGALVM